MRLLSGGRDVNTCTQVALQLLLNFNFNFNCKIIHKKGIFTSWKKHLEKSAFVREAAFRRKRRKHMMYERSNRSFKV